MRPALPGFGRSVKRCDNLQKYKTSPTPDGSTGEKGLSGEGVKGWEPRPSRKEEKSNRGYIACLLAWGHSVIPLKIGDEPGIG